ncbi:DegT/DnrJ/EryC1/StrS family aminotransferase [Patescibacteria group bacterium]|nr:DegT/DnrJ/EryC1/StrS family aminotransferase [Patescibacteria group bacterium]
MILCSNPKAQYRAHKPEIDKEISKVLESGQYILGEQVQSFEREFAQYLGVNFAIGVGSGTEALHIALKAAGLGKGDEVITVSHTAIATVAAIEVAGANPVLVDIESDFYTINPNKLKKAISKKTRAIIPVHLYGQPADLAPIASFARQHRIHLIEDCAQAHGAMYKGKRIGSWGNLACFSFYPTKNLGAFGDGGAIVTSSKKLANTCRMLREYGWSETKVSSIPGWSSRLDELQAAVLRVKLRYLDKDNESRMKLAAMYDTLLAETDLILPKKKARATHVYHQYVVRSERRDALRDFLMKKGIQTLIHYPIPVHLQPAYRGKVKTGGKLKETEHAANKVLSLPIYPELTQTQLRLVVKTIRAFFDQ